MNTHMANLWYPSSYFTDVRLRNASSMGSSGATHIMADFTLAPICTTPCDSTVLLWRNWLCIIVNRSSFYLHHMHPPQASRPAMHSLSIWCSTTSPVSTQLSFDPCAPFLQRSGLTSWALTSISPFNLYLCGQWTSKAQMSLLGVVTRTRGLNVPR